ncbi:Rop family plasmid primer RNA-binding protein, partial [Escherichia coli]|nr:Rop family plasmid primer RNA-binding protein [Escherichia coli]
QADICESLHDHADELYRSCLARFGDDGENLLTSPSGRVSRF